MEPRTGGARPICVSRRARAAAAAAGALAVLAGCGGQVDTAGDVTVLVSARTGAGMDALGSGPLSVVGGCLGLGGFVVVWPPGTDVVDEDPLRLEVPDLGTVGLGDPVRVAGGFVVQHAEGDEVREPGPVEVGGVTVPEPCAAHDVFLAH